MANDSSWVMANIRSVSDIKRLGKAIGLCVPFDSSYHKVAPKFFVLASVVSIFRRAF